MNILVISKSQENQQTSKLALRFNILAIAFHQVHSSVSQQILFDDC